MKKFLFLLLYLGFAGLIGAVTGHFFKGTQVHIFNGVINAIALGLLFKKWNKINDEVQRKKLIQTTHEILTLREQDRREWIAKKKFSWADLSNLVEKIKRHEIDAFDLSEIFSDKMPPNPLVLFQLSIVKKQIAWNGSVLTVALKNLEYLSSQIYDDAILDKFIFYNRCFQKPCRFK